MHSGGGPYEKRVGHRHTQKTDPARHREKVDTSEQRKGASAEAHPADTSRLDFRPPELRERAVCGVGHPVVVFVRAAPADGDIRGPG